VGASRCKAFEIFFQPDIIKKGVMSLQETIWNSLTNCDAEKWISLAENMVLSGGGSIFEGETHKHVDPPTLTATRNAAQDSSRTQQLCGAL
jgi:hypothetical protein